MNRPLTLLRKSLPYLMTLVILTAAEAQAADPKSPLLADEEGLKSTLPQPKVSTKTDGSAAPAPAAAPTVPGPVPAPPVDNGKLPDAKQDVKPVKQEPRPARVTPVPASRPLPKKDAPVPSPTAYIPPKLPSVLDKNTIIAFYGNPRSFKMGVLGEQSIEDTANLIQKQMEAWDNFNGERGVIGCFHLIYGTCHADASVGLLSDETVKAYIDYAAAHNMLVVLDHQLGKGTIETAMNALLPWLKYPNVHLAIDPEWKTPNPGAEIGWISADEINRAERMMELYMVKEGIKERRMFIVHQFNAKMISQRSEVRSDYDHIDLVHHADGFGSPELKLETYNFVASVTNIPIKGFKLFYPKAWKKKGFDIPMMSPEEVLALDPQPLYISYQ